VNLSVPARTVSEFIVNRSGYYTRLLRCTLHFRDGSRADQSATSVSRLLDRSEQTSIRAKQRALEKGRYRASCRSQRSSNCLDACNRHCRCKEHREKISVLPPRQSDAQAGSQANEGQFPYLGYRPRLTGTSSLTEQYLDTTAKSTSSTGAPVYIQGKGAAAVSNFGVTATQTLYNGLQTGNRTRQAEQQVYAAREVLRSTEQTVLLNGATAYMNLLRDAAILELQRSNVNVLEVTLRQTRDRFVIAT
jgi:hypothetical protein